MSAKPRGTTLVEAMVAMTMMLIALLGLASLQQVVSRSSQFGRRMSQASALANDLQGNVRQWDYNDSRLTSSASVTATDATAVTSQWDLGHNTASSYTVQFSDKAGDTNASTPDALGTTYQGLPADIDGDGSADYTRYWNVYAVDLGGTGVPNGKLVQIIVRWKEPLFGYRQVTSSAFKANPAYALQ